MFKVTPLNNWPRAWDEPIWVRIASDKDATVNVYRDSENNPVAQLSVQKGVYDYNIGDAQSVLNDTNKHTLIFVRDDGKRVSIPAKWDRDASVAYISFYDEDTKNQVVVNVDVWNPSEGLIRSSLAPVNSSDVYVCSGCYVEVYRVFDDGTKYYFLQNTSDFTPGAHYSVYLKRDKKFTVEITYEIDYSDEFKARVLGEVFKYIDEAVSFIENYILELASRPMTFAIWLSHRFGIDLPITDVRVEKQTGKVIVTIDYEQDLSPIGIAIIAAVVLFATGAAVAYFIMRASSKSGAVVKLNSDQYFKEKGELAKVFAEKCLELYPNDPDKQRKCLENGEQYVQDVSAPDTALFQKSVETLQQQNKEKENMIKALETVILIAVVGGILIAFLRR